MPRRLGWLYAGAVYFVSAPAQISLDGFHPTDVTQGEGFTGGAHMPSTTLMAPEPTPAVGHQQIHPAVATVVADTFPATSAGVPGISASTGSFLQPGHRFYDEVSPPSAATAPLTAALASSPGADLSNWRGSSHQGLRRRCQRMGLGPSGAATLDPRTSVANVRRTGQQLGRCRAADGAAFLVLARRSLILAAPGLRRPRRGAPERAGS